MAFLTMHKMFSSICILLALITFTQIQVSYAVPSVSSDNMGTQKETSPDDDILVLNERREVLGRKYNQTIFELDELMKQRPRDLIQLKTDLDKKNSEIDSGYIESWITTIDFVLIA